MKLFELKRQLFHIILGITIVILTYYNIISKEILVLITILGGTFCFISKNHKIPIIYWFLETFERPEQLKKFPGKGPFTFFIGTTLSLYLFKPNIALASIMILTLGDSFSHYIGRFYGRRKHPLSNIKLLEGTIAGFIAAAIGALFFVKPLYAVIASFIAMCIEALEIKLKEYILDDNITIPLIAGLVMTILGLYL